MTFHLVVDFLLDLLQKSDEYSRLTGDLFHDLTAKTISDICDSATNVFKNEEILLNLKGDYIIVGDLHGHFFDLIRILKHFGMPPHVKYIFLGDIVDRGEFSLYTTISIFALKCAYPDSIFLIRGNHEFENINSQSGFNDEIKEIFFSDPNEATLVFHAVNQTFSYLPIAIILNDDILCVHGGIGPSFQSIDQINLIARPFLSIYGGIANSILWSDPNDNVDTFRPSKRGVGFDYGFKAIDAFLSNNNLRLLVRGHENIAEGVKYSLQNKVITVFSASNYCGSLNNVSGVLIVSQENGESFHTFPSLSPYIQRPSKKANISQNRSNSHRKSFGLSKSSIGSLNQKISISSHRRVSSGIFPRRINFC
ncbi:Serine/threonine-protein phosphatase PP1 [Tritrichomonas foetus]|uniref:Serine/threonine-protein phosphatase n=1 Tax=Tritrichomonas foetus TaxID=1144522 RepID=A0A1J4KVN6_9EUKA|nr:Serine/threonine-protein phosphatase PP1 [Tritrichomonas foetus]|eukprot:OHT14952.1 Serine/threonine-protein phosphatase PP1 [Tritrichomonas foetus]